MFGKGIFDVAKAAGATVVCFFFSSNDVLIDRKNVYRISVHVYVSVDALSTYLNIEDLNKEKGFSKMLNMSIIQPALKKVGEILES